MSAILSPLVTRQIDEAIESNATAAFAFLERLVAAPSVLGSEASAQEVVAEELRRLGFAVSRLPIPAEIEVDPCAGVPQLPYRDRFNVVGRRGPTAGRSLLLNGHIDVVPVGDRHLWTSEPFTPECREGWLYGRGAADMKAGFAMATLAVSALEDAFPEGLEGPLTIVSVLEEECTGNGTLAACRAGLPW